MNFTRFWLMKKTSLGIDADIFVRAEHETVITLRSVPMIKLKQVQVLLLHELGHYQFNI